METLPAEQSHVIELAYFGGFTHTEIADILDAPVGTVKGRMRLGLEKLRNRLRLLEMHAAMSAARDHDRWADSLGAWLLGALPEDEARGLPAPTSSRLRGLPRGRASRCASPPTRCPPRRRRARRRPRSRARIMAVVEREAALLRRRRAGGRPRATPGAAAGSPRSPGWPLRPALALALAAAAARRRRRRRRCSAATAFDQDARDVVARRSSPSSAARAPRSRSTTATAGSSASELPAPPAGRVYQVWLDKGGKVARADHGALLHAHATARPRSTSPARSTASGA